MGESLIERRRVEDEGLRVVNSFSLGRSPAPFWLGVSLKNVLHIRSIQ